MHAEVDADARAEEERAVPVQRSEERADNAEQIAGPDPSAPLDGWEVQTFGEDSDEDRDDDWELVSPDGHRIDTWREDYPYDSRMSRREYEEQKRSLQIELLKLQTWVKETGQKVV